MERTLITGLVDLVNRRRRDHVIKIEREITSVHDRIGSFRYLVAAAPIPALGHEAVLTVPLASRQREIERQNDELTRGVLTGTVVLVLFAAALGASVAARVSDPVARLTQATRLIAAGRFDGFWEQELHAWDMAAGVLIVEEARGRVTRYDATPIDLFRGQIVASNGRLHDEMLHVIGTHHR